MHFVFLVYCVWMLWLLFGQRLGDNTQDTDLIQQGLNINLVPLQTLRQYWGLLMSDNAYYVRHAIVNLAGNVVLFVPLGWLLPWIWYSFSRFWRISLFGIILMASVEAVQYATGLGSCDVDDLILNVFGIMLGYWIWRIGKRLYRKNSD